MDDNKLIDLIARCAIRDEKALKELYSQIAGYLNYTAYRILRCKDASNEVLQESFFQIWQNAGSYRPHLSKPMTWMNSIVRYRAIDKLNVENRIKSHLTDGDSELLESVADTKNPESEAQSCSLSNHIAHCMSTLSDNIRKSIELAYFNGDSRDDIAIKLNANTSTVKSWLHRGCARLKACLEENRVQL
jgi:RNA polymerase sigma-70 factor (ECF subfamily)